MITQGAAAVKADRHETPAHPRRLIQLAGSCRWRLCAKPPAALAARWRAV
jgi:hypothetical protein